MTRFERLFGCLIGGAVGDALGLPAEKLSPARQKSLFGRIDKMQFLPSRGMISDDTEHALFTARALIESGGDAEKFRRLLHSEFRRWILALPPGTGLATLKSGFKSLAFSAQPGVYSAGNGPAMRAPILGAALGEVVPQLRACLDYSTRMTHTDSKAFWGALAVALASSSHIEADGRRLVREFSEWSDDSESAKQCLNLLKKSINSASRGQSTADFCADLELQNGVSGYIFHTVPVVIQCFLRNKTNFRAGIEEIIACGGDTDTTAAILGGILGAHLGIDAIPADWRGDLWEWPNTPRSMEILARDLAKSLDEGEALVAPRLIFPYQLARNLFFGSVVLIHGFRRMLPPY
ncbi:ADP-ribosylglycohydrolase [Abditibacterium utsteinense]|uniref:ADP-ribosylglycohydrolase n=1 Tax=Abditibacterium utsteinense TaxID=1960156 RepID=A0A2S8SVZ7_9BACT|nr:ADP-ribosylglycohydrolase family protein [Abditibacterium utsteinense]PQV64962.1 ADP-ribosylglycohydrolase [Abditibacterium utsteinense]